MTTEGSMILTQFFSRLWNGLGNVTIPATNISGQMILLFPFAFLVIVKVLKTIFHIQSGGVTSSHRNTRKEK